MHSRAFLITALSFCLFSSQVFAASGDTTGSGSTPKLTAEEWAEEQAWAQRREQTEGWRKEQKEFLSARATFTTSFTQIRQRQAALRADCRVELRKANRDTKLSTTLRCYKGDLALSQELQEKHMQLVERMTFANADLREAALERLSGVADAMSAIQGGIDAGVYESLEDIEEARMNLRDKYERPLRTTLARLRADTERTWVSFLLVQAKDIAEAEETDALEPAIQCLIGHEQILGALSRGESVAAMSSLPLAECKSMVKDAREVLQNTSSGSTVNP